MMCEITVRRQITADSTCSAKISLSVEPPIILAPYAKNLCGEDIKALILYNITLTWWMKVSHKRSKGLLFQYIVSIL
jgi:hypothetical protein